MGVELRTALFVTLAIALAGCGESFAMTESGGTGGTGGGTTSTTTTGGTGGDSGGGPTTAGDGGTGGAPCDDSDADEDGFSECDGDCDDSVPFMYPGAIEICGDDIDENCDGKSDQELPCDGIGTFVSETKGNIGATGTMKDPVATIGEALEKAAIIRANSMGEPTAILVAAGTYIEDIVLTGNISLVGGYDPEDWSKRDPKAYETTIKNTKAAGLRLIATEQPMMLYGFSVQGRSVSLGTDTSVAVTIDGGEPILVDNEILGGNVTVGTGASIGVRVITETAGGSEVALLDNEIKAGTSIGGGSYGVSVEAEPLYVALGDNQIVAAQGTESVALLVSSAAGVDAYRNTLQAATATGASGVDSTALGAWVKKGALTFDANLVNPDQVFNPPKCFTPAAWCGGLRVSTPGAILTNNIVYGSASANSAALHLLELGESLADVAVSSNLLLGAGALGAQSRSTAVILASPMPDAGLTLLGRFRNNIFLGGIAEKNFAFWEDQTSGETVEPVALDHNLFFFPVSGSDPGTLYLDWNGLAESAITMLDGLPGEGANLFENPLVTDGHLDPASPCRNKGTELDAPKVDRDGDDRPQEGEFDIGPDELVIQN